MLKFKKINIKSNFCFFVIFQIKQIKKSNKQLQKPAYHHTPKKPHKCIYRYVYKKINDIHTVLYGNKRYTCRKQSSKTNDSLVLSSLYYLSDWRVKISKTLSLSKTHKYWRNSLFFYLFNATCTGF